MKGILIKPEVWKGKQKALDKFGLAVTRRVIKPQPELSISDEVYKENLRKFKSLKTPYQVGETVYIKEAFRYIQGGGEVHDFGVWYKLDGEYKWWRDNGGIMNYPINEKNRSPLFMPAWAARHFIQITDVRAGDFFLPLISPEELELEGGTAALDMLAQISGKWVFRYEFEKVNRE